MAKHQLTVVADEDTIVAVHWDCSDSNIDGTLRIYESGYLAADYGPGVWTHIQLVEVDVGQVQTEAPAPEGGESAASQ